MGGGRVSLTLPIWKHSNKNFKLEHNRGNDLMFGNWNNEKQQKFNLFLMDGEVTGRIKCTLSNWTDI